MRLVMDSRGRQSIVGARSAAESFEKADGEVDVDANVAPPAPGRELIGGRVRSNRMEGCRVTLSAMSFAPIDDANAPRNAWRERRASRVRLDRYRTCSARPRRFCAGQTVSSASASASGERRAKGAAEWEAGGGRQGGSDPSGGWWGQLEGRPGVLSSPEQARARARLCQWAGRGSECGRAIE